MAKLWHDDLPPGTEEVWDMIAKALLLRLGGSVTLSEAELRVAGETACEVRVERSPAASKAGPVTTYEFRVKPQ
jgi:hypothetical protein